MRAARALALFIGLQVCLPLFGEKLGLMEDSLNRSQATQMAQKLSTVPPKDLIRIKPVIERSGQNYEKFVARYSASNKKRRGEMLLKLALADQKDTVTPAPPLPPEKN